MKSVHRIRRTRFIPSRRIAPIVALALAVASTVALAQTNRLTISAGNLARFGTQGDMNCVVQLIITNTTASAIRDIRVHRAVDDQGKDLNRAIADEPLFDELDAMRLYNQMGWLAVLHLKAPDDSARTIKELSGEIDMAFPTRENGGLVQITNFMAHPGSPIPSAGLAKLGIRLTFQTLESFEAYQRAHPKPYVDPHVVAIEENCFTGIYNSPTNPPRSSVAIQVEDPNKVLIGFAFETAAGKKISPAHTSVWPDIRCYHFAKSLPDDLNLVVTATAPGVIHTEPFRLTEIKLPWK